MDPSGLALKNEPELFTAVSVPRVGEVMVTLLPLTPTTPVKSSRSSSWLEAKFALVRGSVKAVNTGDVGFRLTVNVPPEREMALFRLKSSPIPCVPEAAAVKVKDPMVGVPFTDRAAVQTESAAQVLEPVVIAEPVSLKKVIVEPEAGLDSETLTV